MSTIEDTFIQSPLVAIFWTTYIPFMIVVLYVVGRSAIRFVRNLWIERSPEGYAGWAFNERTWPTRPETGDYAIGNFRTEPSPERHRRPQAEPPQFRFPERTQHFRNAYAWRARLTALQQNEESARPHGEPPSVIHKYDFSQRTGHILSSC
jgi:hypothetical protein